MNRISIATLIGMATLGVTAQVSAAPDWSKAPERQITLFYPGPSSMEWVLRGTEHGGARAFKAGETCESCHDQEAADIGNKIVSGNKPELEAQAVKHTPSIPVTMQAAYDAENLYIRMKWKQPPASGGEKTDADNQMKVAMMLGDDSIQHGAGAGCWAACHHDARSMPDVDPNAAKHPQAAALNIQADGPTKYLAESRTSIEPKTSPRGGWDKLKTDAEIAAELKAGHFLDIVQFRSAGAPMEGYVLESRHMSENPDVASGGLEGDTWTVTFVRKLAGAAPGDHKIVAGKQYSVGFAIHDDHTIARNHVVSLGYTLGLDDAKANINAVKQ